jgi:hypothetical protein
MTMFANNVDNSLHIALTNCRSEDEVIALIEQYPEAVKYTGGKGLFPIQIACDKEYSLAVVQKLYFLHKPACTQITSTKQAFSEQLLCIAIDKFEHADDLILDVTTEFPDAVTKACKDGWYPLHGAFYSGQPVNIILKLIDAFPQAVSKQTVTGEYPLHFALFHNARVILISRLIDLFPRAIMEKDSDGDYPLHCIRNEVDDSFYLILDELPQVIREKKQ